VVLFIKFKLEIKRRSRVEKALIEAKKEAESANRTKSVFLANMTHEIRTPMNAILGYSELLQRDPALSPEQRRNLEIINSSGEQLLSLINDVLDMSRIEADKISYDESTFNFAALIEQTSALLIPMASKKGIDFSIRTDQRLPQCMRSDGRKIRQILLNLTSNAVKYSESGSIGIEALLSNQKHNQCIVSVHDSGVGIGEEDRKRIYQPFERAAMSTTDKGGTGLGLTTSKKFARFLGGDSWLEHSGPGGSTFCFSFNFSKAEQTPLPRVEARGKIVAVKENCLPVKILIADDRYTNRDIFEKLFLTLGCTVRTARNGLECIDIFRQWRPDCILIDILMPEIDGIEAVKIIRGEEGGGVVKIVALTASALDEDKQGILEAGADMFMYKPYREEQLLEAIARLLDIEYEYEDILPLTDIRDTTTFSLSPDIRDDLEKAVRRGSRSDIITVLEKVRLPDDVDRRVRMLAEEYRFSEILKILDGSPEDTIHVDE